MNGKEAAGEKAAKVIQEGMCVGLGTGSTVYYFLKALAREVARGLLITGIATSRATAELAQKWSIPLQSLNDISSRIDLTVDGVDQFTSDRNGIKGGGGALLYEKMVAVSSEKCIWIADSSKKVAELGTFPLPVEVVPFGWKLLYNTFKSKGYRPVLRRLENGGPFVTDAGHFIIDLHLQLIKSPQELADELDHLTGVVEHGLFLGLTNQVIIGFPDGHTETLQR